MVVRDDEQVMLSRSEADMALETEGEQLYGASSMSIEERSRLWWRDAVVNSLFILSWFIFATLLSLYNKWMFSKDYYGFSFPLFVTTMHMATQFVLAGTVRKLWPAIFNPPGQPTVREYIQKCIPCGVATGLDIGLSNLSLKTITLSLYTMCKSSSLIFVLSFAFLFRLERFSIRLVSVIVLITGGVLLMVLTTEPQAPLSNTAAAHRIRSLLAPMLNHPLPDLLPRAIPAHFKTPLAIGVMLVLSASAFGGLRWALTQLLLTAAHGHAKPKGSSAPNPRVTMGMDNPAATIFYLTPTSFFSLLIVASFVEGPFPATLTASGFFDTFGSALKTCFIIFVPGAIAFAMVMSEYYIIQRTGIVPMSIAGIFKEVFTILMATWLFSDSLTLVNWIGLLITTAGIVIFTYHKYQKSVLVPEDEHTVNSNHSISLLEYNAISDEEDAEHDDMDERDIASRERDRLTSRSYSPDVIFDASRVDEVAGRRDSELVMSPVDDRGIFSPPATGNFILSSPTSPRVDRRKDRRVRFDVDEDENDEAPQSPAHTKMRSLDFR